MLTVPHFLKPWQALIVLEKGERYKDKHEFTEAYLSAAADKEPELLKREPPPAPWWVMN